MSVALTILWIICTAACAIVIAWAAFLAAYIKYCLWRERRDYDEHARLRAEGF